MDEETRREHDREYNKRYREVNREKIAEQRARYRAANKAKISEANRQYRTANGEKVAEGKKVCYERRREDIVVRVVKLQRLRRGMVFAPGQTVESLVQSQEGRCALCGDPLGQKFHVDHCHETGKVRGALHHNCNVGLGHFKDSPERLEAAAAYIRKHRQ